jgi:hypothetical protein
MQGPPPQSELIGLAQHWAAKQVPPQHRSPPSEEQSESLAQAEQTPLSQTFPVGQSEVSQQSPCTQPEAQHSPPSPHSLSVRHIRQPVRPQTSPLGQLATSQPPPVVPLVLGLVEQPTAVVRAIAHATAKPNPCPKRRTLIDRPLGRYRRPPSPPAPRTIHFSDLLFRLPSGGAA